MNRCFRIPKRSLIYRNDFSSKTKPPGWREWESGFHPSSWDNQLSPIAGRPSIIFGESDELTMGALYDLASPQNGLLASFLFKTPPNTDELVDNFEILDYYDKDFNEICDAFLNPSCGITLFANNRNAKTLPMPHGQVVRIWMRYKLVDGLSIASVAWAPDGECEPKDGRKAVISTTDQAAYNTPVTSILLGPWHAGIHGIYADFSMATI